MQKLDDYRPLFEQSMRQFLQFKKHQLEAKSQQTLALKPTNQIAHFRQRSTGCERALQQYFCQRISQYQQKLEHKKQQLDYFWQIQQARRKHLFNQESLKAEAHQIITAQIALYRRKLEHISDMLKALDPKKLLQKGYSILFAEKELSVINSVAKLKKGQQAKLLLSDGEIIITINEVIIK